MERANVLRDPTRIDLLFTMSEIPHGGSCSGSRMRSDVSRTNYSWLGSRPVFALASFAGHASINLTAPPRVALGEAWWSQTGSNRRPHACKARALPAELWPRNQKTNASLSHVEPKFASTGPPSQALRRGSLRSRWPAEPEAAEQRRLVGLGRLELPTSRLSSARSNRLSYKPLTLSLENKDQGLARANWRLKRRMQSHKRLAPGACSSAKKEKRRRRNPAYGAQQS